MNRFTEPQRQLLLRCSEEWVEQDGVPILHGLDDQFLVESRIRSSCADCGQHLRNCRCQETVTNVRVELRLTAKGVEVQRKLRARMAQGTDRWFLTRSEAREEARALATLQNVLGGTESYCVCHANQRWYVVTVQRRGQTPPLMTKEGNKKYQSGLRWFPAPACSCDAGNTETAVRREASSSDLWVHCSACSAFFPCAPRTHTISSTQAALHVAEASAGLPDMSDVPLSAEYSPHNDPLAALDAAEKAANEANLRLARDLAANDDHPDKAWLKDG